MQGKSSFELPDNEKLRTLAHYETSERKRKLAKDLFPEDEKRALIQLVNLELKEEVTRKKQTEADALKNYIKNYQVTEDMTTNQGARNLLGNIAKAMDLKVK